MFEYKIQIVVVFILLLIGCNKKLNLTSGQDFAEFKMVNREGEFLLKLKCTYPNISVNKQTYSCKFQFIFEQRNPIFRDYQFQKEGRCKDYMKSDSVTFIITKVDERIFDVGAKKIKVIKYYYDEPNSWDEEETILINEELGILFIHQYWGMTYELTNHPKMNSRILSQLREKIKSNKSFYRTYESCL